MALIQPQWVAADKVVLDFQSAPLGTFSTRINIPDGLGGKFTLTPSPFGSIGTTYEIVDESGDRELRISDIGSVPGEFLLDITHSEGNFTPISGGDYEALIGLSCGNFSYVGQNFDVFFRDDCRVSTSESTPIIFEPQSPSSIVRFRGNGHFRPGTNISVDVDDLVFDVQVVAGPISVVEAVIDALANIIDLDVSKSVHKVDKLEHANTKLETALDELAKSPSNNQVAVEIIGGVVVEFEAAVNDMLLDLAQGTDLMDQLAGVVRQLAETATDEAIARGGDAGDTSEAKLFLLEGDAHRMAGSFSIAIDVYREALKQAERA